MEPASAGSTWPNSATAAPLPGQRASFQNGECIVFVDEALALRFRCLAEIICLQVPYLKKVDVFQLWHGLSVLPKNYEDSWREWFLPTELGQAMSAPPD